MVAALSCTMGMNAQMNVANFENGVEQGSTISLASTNSSLFTTPPSIMLNPQRDGINPSAKCLGAVNVANADWYGNVVCLKLTEAVKVDYDHRFLSFLMLRGEQPKNFRVGINGYEAANEVYLEKLTSTGQWERVLVDLSEKFNGQTINEIYFVYSCNWDNPRTGWGEIAYYIDDVTLSDFDVPDAVVAVDPSVTYQTIHHFGASDCWMADYVGKYFSKTEREKAAKMLFSRTIDATGAATGIGLSNWRVNLGAGSASQGSNSNIEDETRRADCFLTADDTYDWTRQAGQQYFMQQAKDYGVEHFTLFSNSAPIYYTKNGKANANNSLFVSCNLASSNFPKFAKFLATTTKHFVDEGYNISFVSPINEPQFDWRNGQEGSPWTNGDVAGMTRALNTEFVNQGLTTKIMIPEASSLDKLYSGSTLLRGTNQISAFFGGGSNDISGLSNVYPAVAAHSYWTFSTNSDLRHVREQARDAARAKGIEVMQTEWSLLDAEPSTETGFPSSYDKASYMDIALFMGKVIHCDMAFGDMPAWNFWTAFDREQYGQKDRFMLIRLRPSNGDDYASLENGGTVEAQKTLWALGNYSLFIRPGYKRVQLEGGAEMNNILASAYISPEQDKLVIVYVNTSSVRRYTSLRLRGINKEVDKISRYVTSSTQNLKLSGTHTATDRMVIPARSIATLVVDLKSSFLKGDVNRDGVVDVSDVTTLINMILGSTPMDQQVADIDENGTVDVSDVTTLINMILH